MKGNQARYTSIFVIIAVFSMPLWLTWFSDFNLPKQTELIKSFDSKTEQQAMDEILATDLALTTSLFINQLAKQFEKWKYLDVDSSEWSKIFQEEIAIHQHLHSLALVHNNEITTYHGEISTNEVNKLLDRHQAQEVIYSDPYIQDEELLMLIAHRKEKEKWLVGEINLAFVKEYVRDIASVADAKGNMFISATDDVHMEWEEDEERNRESAKKKVPELDWNIVIYSKPQGKKGRKGVERYKEGEVVARFKEDVQVEQWLEKDPLVKVRQHNGLHYILVHEELNTAQFLNKLQQDAAILRAEPNYKLTKQESSLMETKATNSAPNDEFFHPYQWNLRQIGSEFHWDFAAQGENVIIAVLDTGVDVHHEDLAQKIMTGYNAYDGSNVVHDEHGHGTHVTGIATAITNNLTGIAGISWFNPVMPVKVLNAEGEGSLFEVAAGIKWATDHGAKVINLSLGDAQESEILYEAIRYAYEQDVVLIAAAGNDNVATPMYPAAYEEVLAVAAVDHERNKASFSNYGKHIDVSAPGENIPSTFPDNNYVFMSGTSMAAPHVTGLAGLIRSLKPELSNEEVVQLIRQTSDDLGPTGYDQYFGFGEINIASALNKLQVENFASHLGQRQSYYERLANWFAERFYYFPGKRRSR